MRRRPLWLHAAALAMLLGGLALYTGTRSAFVTDESFVVIQLDAIEQTGRWTLPHPLPEADPDGAAFPLHNATRYDSGYTLYGKHPALIYLYLPVHRLLGLSGLIALSVLGTVGAAVVAGVIAERIRPGAGPIGLWLVGAGSPLLFDAFLIHGHTVAAALAALAVYLALRVLEGRGWRYGVGAVIALYATGLLRTEGVLFATALGAALMVWALARRRMALLAAGVGAVAAGVGALATDRWWAPVVADGTLAPQASFGGVSSSFVSARATSLGLTTIKPGYGEVGIAEVAVLLGATLLIVGAWLVRRHPDERGAALFPAAGAGVLLVRAIVGWGAVPGLLLAFGVGVAGLVLVKGAVWRAAPARLALATGGAFVVAVALTQYRAGGHTEWGGRYFALAVPVLGAVAAAALAQAWAELPRPQARTLQASVLVASIALGVLAVRTVHETHDRNRQRSDAVLSAAAALPPADDGGAPIVVIEDEQVPRLARGRYEEVRFLNVPRQLVGTYLDRLAVAGYDDVLLVAFDPAETMREIPERYERIGPVVPYPLQWEGEGGILHLRRTPAPGDANMRS